MNSGFIKSSQPIQFISIQSIQIRHEWVIIICYRFNSFGWIQFNKNETTLENINRIEILERAFFKLFILEMNRMVWYDDSIQFRSCWHFTTSDAVDIMAQSAVKEATARPATKKSGWPWCSSPTFSIPYLKWSLIVDLTHWLYIMLYLFFYLSK